MSFLRAYATGVRNKKDTEDQVSPELAWRWDVDPLGHKLAGAALKSTDRAF
jgi:hypothetical protein